MFSTYQYIILFWLRFFNYQTIGRVFLKTLQKSIFVDSCFFSYFRGFGEELSNPEEEPKREKTHLVRIHLQEWIFIYQDNIEYFAEINVLISVIPKISRECNMTNERQIHNICENIFQGDTADFRKIIWRKVTSIIKSREFSRIFGHI